MDREILPESKMQAVYKLVYNLRASNNIKVGFNEAAKSLNNGTALLTIVVMDAVPACLVEPLPVVCEQKGVDFVRVSSKSALGKACRLQVDVIACSIFAGRNEDSARLVAQISQALK